MAQNIVINGVTYQEVPEVDIPKSGGGTAKFYDTASANITGSDLPVGKTGFGANGSVSGSMPVNGDVSGTITTKAGTVVIPAGQTTGGTVGIASAEQDKIIAGTISRRAHGQNREAVAIVKIVLKTAYGIVFAVLWMAKGYATAFLKGL